MSLARVNEVLLRILVDSLYTAKGDTLSFMEEDTNFKILADAILELANADVSGLEAFNPALEYSDEDFVSYDGNVWKYINAAPQTGIVPGTDPLTWELSSIGAFAHLQNSDTKLAEGTANEVSAAEIRSHIDSANFTTQQLWITPDGRTIKVTMDDTNQFAYEDLGLGTVGVFTSQIWPTPDGRYVKVTMDNTNQFNYEEL